MKEDKENPEEKERKIQKAGVLKPRNPGERKSKEEE